MDLELEDLGFFLIFTEKRLDQMIPLKVPFSPESYDPTGLPKFKNSNQAHNWILHSTKWYAIMQSSHFSWRSNTCPSLFPHPLYQTQLPWLEYKESNH